MEWDAEKLNRWGKLAAEFFIACIPVIGPGAAVIAEEGANAALDAAKEKWESIPERIRKECKKRLSTGTEEQKLLVRTAAEIMLVNLQQDLLNNYIATDELAKQVTKAYLERHQQEYGGQDLESLNQYLPPVVQAAIDELKHQLEGNKEFQSQWKECTTLYAQETRGIAVDAKATAVEAKETSDRNTEVIAALKRAAPGAAPIAGECSDPYRFRWEDPLFLEGIKKEKQTLLRDIYQLPYYDSKAGKDQADLQARLEHLLACPESKKERMLVVLGQPGIGKSTLITYLLNKCHQTGTLRVYRFAGLKSVYWEDDSENLPGQILQAIFGADDQSRLNNSILILDGLDEVDMGGNQTAFLNTLYDQWVRAEKIKKFRLLVTCRVNRIPDTKKLKMPFLELCPLNEEQILKFTQIYNPGIEKKISRLFLSNAQIRQILGIPIILYMVLALGVDVSSNMGKMDIYDRIFSPEGENSIYRRGNYDELQKERSPEKIREIHAFSKAVAVEMWKTDPENACLGKSQCQEIAHEILPMTEETKDAQLRDLLIGQYFIEGQEGQELYFVHRSIYEYFVALSLFDWMQALQSKADPPEDLFKAMESADKAGNKTKDAALAAFADALGSRDICRDGEIKEGLLWLMQKAAPKTDGTENPVLSPDCWREFLVAFQLYGLEHAANHKTKGVEQIFAVEGHRFFNLILLVKLVIKANGEKCPFTVLKCLENRQSEFFCVKDIVKDLSETKMSAANLERGDLRGSDLHAADMCKANLSGAYLNKSDLRQTNLYEADLRGAYLIRANLRGVNLHGANLRGCYLLRANLSEAELKETNLNESDLRQANLHLADLSGCSLREANLHRSNLHGANLHGANLHRTDLSGADLSKADLRGADLSEADLRGVDLQETDLREANLNEADLRDANLNRANLVRGNLSGANLDRVNLFEGDLRGADLHEADLSGADLRRADLYGAKAYRSTFKDALHADTDGVIWLDDLAPDEP